MSKNWFVAIDYSQLEARLIGMASKDKILNAAILSGYDIHQDWALRFLEAFPPLLGLRKAKDASKKQIKTLRSIIKNEVVFPWIYDSSPRSIARNLSIPEEIVFNLHTEFWEMFAGIKEYKKTVHKFYERYHYVETLVGSRRHAPLKFTERVNTVIQGTGGYVTMGAMNRLGLAAYELGRPQYHARLNIHDELCLSIPNKDLERDIEYAAREMVRKTHTFMDDMPLGVEVSVGRNWGELEEIAQFDTRDFDY